MVNPKAELILFNHDRSLDASAFLDKTHTKVSTIFGTPADGYTLSINRYDDKKLKIIDNSFRIMGSQIKIEKDAINRLYISGERISNSMKTKPAIQSKDQNDLFHVDDHYCDINGEILTIKADSEDLYFYNEGNIAVDIGTKRRSLMAIPFLRRVDVIKYRGKFICIVELDKKFIKERLEVPKQLFAINILREKVNEINSYFDNSERISRIIVQRKFFEEYDRTSHIISKKNYIEYLDQLPFN